MTLGRLVRVALAAVVVLLGAAQLVRRPEFRNPSLVPARLLQAHLAVPAGIDTLLRRACYDCHSHETRWPWYARIAPVSWLVASDVRQGRADLNFSEWGTDPDREPTQSQRLGGICSDLRRGIMPLRSYRLLHPESRLRAAEVEEVCAWTTGARAGLAP